jgi:hypothetical protein
MTQVSDDDLMDFWCIEVEDSGELILVTEETARLVIKNVNALDFTTPMVKFMDLCGEENHLRCSMIIRVYHSSPEGRALDARQSVLLKRDRVPD